MAAKKRTLKQVQAKMRRMRSLLEKVPAWQMSEQNRLIYHIAQLEKEQFRLLGTS